ncbi:MAG: hypothetical protein HQM10_04755 [Candidatus Riflebacteria bacterium]|nr:hypothetical protein [Candidatus Riflebacteria bacterium]
MRNKLFKVAISLVVLVQFCFTLSAETEKVGRADKKERLKAFKERLKTGKNADRQPGQHMEKRKKIAALRESSPAAAAFADSMKNLRSSGKNLGVEEKKAAFLDISAKWLLLSDSEKAIVEECFPKVKEKILKMQNEKANLKNLMTAGADKSCADCSSNGNASDSEKADVKTSESNSETKAVENADEWDIPEE